MARYHNHASSRQNPCCLTALACWLAWNHWDVVMKGFEVVPWISWSGWTIATIFVAVRDQSRRCGREHLCVIRTFLGASRNCSGPWSCIQITAKSDAFNWILLTWLIRSRWCGLRARRQKRRRRAQLSGDWHRLVRSAACWWWLSSSCTALACFACSVKDAAGGASPL